MLNEIEQILLETPGLKGREIAKKLGVPKKEVNSFLAKHLNVFIKDSNYCWSVANKNTLRIELEDNSWVNCQSFENSLSQVNSPFESKSASVVFVVPNNCRILLDAATRLLALCNQLAWQNKDVSIDFKDSEDTLSYLDRIGFLKYLDDSVSIIPSRPLFSGADLFDGNSDTVVEFGEINPKDLDESTPKKLKNRFVSHAGKKYSATAFTIISELYGNVRDHSQSPIPGLVGLQYYKKGPKGPHIQTVISDSGIGIVGSLMPILNNKYPKLAAKYDFSDPKSAPLLVKEIFKKGGITQTDEEGRGLGLKRSGDVAAKFDARVSIRQETFELKLIYKNGLLYKHSYTLCLPKLLGTHMCFDFLLDARG